MSKYSLTLVYLFIEYELKSTINIGTDILFFTPTNNIYTSFQKGHATFCFKDNCLYCLYISIDFKENT